MKMSDSVDDNFNDFAEDLSPSGFEHTLERPQPVHIQAHYQPPDQANFWMFCMIGMGTAFVIFVIASIYLMCKSQKNSNPTPIRRHPTSKSRGVGAAGERPSVAIREHL